jgi:glycine cleavage system H protein
MFVEFPEDLRYTKEHEWVRLEGTRARVGITDFAQDALGDVVYVDLPEIGAVVQAGQPLGEVESTKSVSDIYAPVSGTVVAVNESLEASPELINSGPYQAGWMIDVRLADDAEDVSGDLLDAAAYRELTGS